MLNLGEFRQDRMGAGSIQNSCAAGVCATGWFSKGAGMACALMSGFHERVKICAFSAHQVINTLDFGEPVRKCFIFVTLLEVDMKGKFWVHSRFDTMVQLFVSHVRVGTSEEAVLILDSNGEIPEGTHVLVEL